MISPEQSGDIKKNYCGHKIELFLDNLGNQELDNLRDHKHQANRAFIIGRIKTIVPKILCNLFDLSVIDRLYKESLRCRSQIMPERTFRRKKNKAIGRTHFNNKKVAF